MKKQIKELLQCGLPCILRGAPGIAKSAYLRSIAEENGRKAIDLRVAMMPPEDLVGIPKIQTNTDSFTYYPPHWAKMAEQNGGSGLMVILEEIHLAPPAMHAALYQLAQEKVVSGISLPNIWVAATANYAEDAGNGWAGEMPPALLDRFEIIEASSLSEINAAAHAWLKNLADEIGTPKDIQKILGLSSSGSLSLNPRATERLLRIIHSGCRDHAIIERRAGKYHIQIMKALMDIPEEEERDIVQKVFKREVDIDNVKKKQRRTVFDATAIMAS